MTTTEIMHSVAEGEAIELNTDLDPITVGTMEIRATSSTITLSDGHRLQAEDIIGRSLDVFNLTEATQAIQAIGRPTLLARLDTTIGKDGFVPFECEERPAGLGVIDLLTRRATGIGIGDQLQAHVAGLTQQELFAVHTDQTDNDDAAVMSVVRVGKLPALSSVIARVGREDNLAMDVRRRLAAMSISTVHDEGDKRYMQAIEEFGVRLITSSDELPEAGVSFVLKELQGSRSKGVHAYLSCDDRKIFGKQRTVTRSKAAHIVDSLAGVTVEPIKRPVAVYNLGNMIFRILATVSADSVHVIGGVFCIKENMVVTGSQAATGAIVCG